MMEINRVSSHWVALATGGMEMGALTAMTNGLRARERCLDMLEMITGLRMNHAYVRPGGVAQDLPENAIDKLRHWIVDISEEIAGLRRFKDDVTEVRDGFECGINLGSFNDIQIDDLITTYEMREIPRA